MINDDDCISINKPELMPINNKQLNERLAMEESDHLLVNELFRNINDASKNDTPIINNKINVIAEKLKRVKRDNAVKDLIGTERHIPLMNKHTADKHTAGKRPRFINNFKKDKLMAIKIGSQIDRIDEEADDEAYYDIEDKLLYKR